MLANFNDHSLEGLEREPHTEKPHGIDSELKSSYRITGANRSQSASCLILSIVVHDDVKTTLPDSGCATVYCESQELIVDAPCVNLSMHPFAFVLPSDTQFIDY
jgi:hypothetical protein